MSNESNYLSDSNDKCTWTLGKSFDRSMDPDRIHPRITLQKARAIELEDEVIKHSPKSIDLSLDLVQKWCEFMDETWERNKFLASKSGIKLMKYGGLFDLREKFGNSIISKSTKDYFKNNLSDHEVSVEVLDNRDGKFQMAQDLSNRDNDTRSKYLKLTICVRHEHVLIMRCLKKNLKYK